MDEAEDHCAIADQVAVLVVDVGPDLHPGHRLLLHPGDHPEDVSHPGRGVVMRLDRYHRHHDSALFQLRDGQSDIQQELVPAALEVADVVRMMDYPHQVRLIVADLDLCL